MAVAWKLLSSRRNRNFGGIHARQGRGRCAATTILSCLSGADRCGRRHARRVRGAPRRFGTGGHVRCAGLIAEYDHPYAETVAIRGDPIIAVGSLGSVEQIAGPTAREVDLHGRFLMPGMIDAHVHPIGSGISLIQANFPDTACVPALVQFVADQMRKRESMRSDVLVINQINNSY